MKYIEKYGEVEYIIEGTPEEIMDLYNKMNPEESFMGEPMPTGSQCEPKGHNPCQPINIVQNPNSNLPYVCHNAIVDKVADKISEKLCKKAILGV